MKRILCAAALALFGVSIAWQPVEADGILKRHHAKPECEPGFKIVEEVVMQDVVRTVCKMVPETKKKWVYAWIPDPFCILDAHHHCPQCDGPHCRKLLVKRLVDEPCPTLKCVTETIVEKVPVTVYRKVPCAPGEVIPTLPTPLPKK